jgi:hypothetical protein
VSDCCGFLSFSLVFCLLGGWFEASLYIHFIRNWVETKRHFSASREGADEKKGGEARRSSQLGFVGRMWSLSTGLSS